VVVPLNVQVLRAFGPLLTATGFLAYFQPPSPWRMSNAAPYNDFHIAFGVVGTALGFWGTAESCAWFNFLFGLVDLYQLAAGRLKLWPNEHFKYTVMDDVMHLIFGAGLAIVGASSLNLPFP
jgi:hypothetical protein